MIVGCFIAEEVSLLNDDQAKMQLKISPSETSMYQECY